MSPFFQILVRTCIMRIRKVNREHTGFTTRSNRSMMFGANSIKIMDMLLYLICRTQISILTTCILTDHTSYYVILRHLVFKRKSKLNSYRSITLNHYHSSTTSMMATQHHKIMHNQGHTYISVFFRFHEQITETSKDIVLAAMTTLSGIVTVTPTATQPCSSIARILILWVIIINAVQPH